ncbi:hypothetical protein [Streptomyces chrestomyceticus]
MRASRTPYVRHDLESTGPHLHNPSLPPPMPLDEHGRGMAIIDALADYWE